MNDCRRSYSAEFCRLKASRRVWSRRLMTRRTHLSPPPTSPASAGRGPGARSVCQIAPQQQCMVIIHGDVVIYADRLTDSRRCRISAKRRAFWGDIIWAEEQRSRQWEGRRMYTKRSFCSRFNASYNPALDIFIDVSASQGFLTRSDCIPRCGKQSEKLL